MSGMMTWLDPFRYPTKRTVDWEPVFDSLSTRLPDDYVWYIENVLPGTFYEILTIYSPIASTASWSLLERGTDDRSALTLMDELGLRCPPTGQLIDMSSLVPFGTTSLGDTMYWTGIGLPSSWTVVAGNLRDNEWHAFDCNFDRFICELAARTLRSEFFDFEDLRGAPFYGGFEHFR